MSVGTAIVVPVHNGSALTRACLETVLATIPAGCEIVVVDDASEDDTAEVLQSFGNAIHLVRLERNAGFATACNRGAAEASGDTLVFLNNDTQPRAGWLEALLDYATSHPKADVVGAKLVYPTGAVQHAGVVFGVDGYPHNLYAGFPGDHPAVNRSRRLQAVTAACLLVHREAFERAGGFDVGFENSLEDVDLCLRIGEQGGEVHFCHAAVVEHLESASRGRSQRFDRSVALYRERWRERVRRDDVAVYVEDGLVDVEYPSSYPLRLEVAPQLATVHQGSEDEIERMLESYARQVSDLLHEVVRLTVAVGDRGVAASPGAGSASGPIDHSGFLEEARRIEAEIQRLQLMLESGDRGFSASPQLGYRELVEQVRATVAEHVPAGATVLVVSRGDRELVRLDDRSGWHFPHDDAGNYVGHHPHDSTEAIAQLESLRAAGARYIVFPASAAWWLDHYSGLAEHLLRYPRIEQDACTIFSLDDPV